MLLLEEGQLRYGREIRHRQKLFAEDKVGGFGYQPFLHEEVLRRLRQLDQFLAALKIGY